MQQNQLKDDLLINLNNLAIPRNTMIVHIALKKLTKRIATITNKTTSELYGMNVIESQLFPFICDDGSIINGAIYDDKGNITFLRQE